MRRPSYSLTLILGFVALVLDAVMFCLAFLVVYGVQ